MNNEADATRARDQIVDRLRGWLDGYGNHAESTIEVSGGGALPGSLAAEEIDSPEASTLAPEWEPKMLSNAFGLAALRLVAAVDHLRSLSRLVAPAPGPAIYATYTVGAAGFEPAASAV